LDDLFEIIDLVDIIPIKLVFEHGTIQLDDASESFDKLRHLLFSVWLLGLLFDLHQDPDLLNLCEVGNLDFALLAGSFGEGSVGAAQDVFGVLVEEGD